MGTAAAIVGMLSAGWLAPVASAQPRPDPAARRQRAARLRATGEAYLQAGDPGSAIAYYRDAIALDPRDSEAYAALARIYLDRGSLQTALEVWTAGVRRCPDVPELWRGLASALEAGGHLEEARQALRALLENASDDVRGHLQLSALARRQGAWSEALSACRAVLDLAATGKPVAEADLAEARRYGHALLLLTGSVDPVGGDRQCQSRSPVRRALARCP